MVNAKTPNKKRKSLANAEGQAQIQSPKVAKLNTSVKTPGKGKGNATPGKPNNKTPKQQNNVAKTPAEPEKNVPKTPKQTPVKVEEQNTAKKGNQKVKRSSESENENSPSKKLKMFPGTAALQEPQGKKKQPQGKKEGKKAVGPDGKPIKRKGQFFNLKEKLNTGDKAALKELEGKIKAFEGRKELTKTARRKLKLLQKLKRVASGEESATTKAPTVSKKRRERKKGAKKLAGEGAQTAKAEGDESDSSESDYEVDAIIKPDKIIQTSQTPKEEDDSEDDEEEEASGEEEESDEDDDAEEDDDSEEESEEEEEAPPAAIKQTGKKPQSKQTGIPNVDDLKENQIINKKQSRYVVFVGNLPFDATKQEISEHFQKAGEIRDIRIPNDKQTNKPRGFAYAEFNDEISYQKALSLHHTSIKGRRINVLYTQGGKKKGEEKKNEVKAKNLKLQAMRKQGQLAGSVKQNQKRSARRNKNAKPSLNGSN